MTTKQAHEPTAAPSGADLRHVKPLGDLADFRKGAAVGLPGDSGETELDPCEGLECYEVLPGDIDQFGFINAPRKRLKFSAGTFGSPAVQTARIEPGDIILTDRSRDDKFLRVALVEKIPEGQAWFFGQMMTRLRDVQPDPAWTFLWLNSEPVKQELRGAAMPGTRSNPPRINQKALKACAVAMPGEDTAAAEIEAKRRHYEALKAKNRLWKEAFREVSDCAEKPFL